jgi:hypothetical protein
LRRTRSGSRINPNATVIPPLLDRSFDDSILAALGNCTVSVTFVAPAPAAIEAGENVAVAPAGKPVTANVIGAAKDPPFCGVIANV